MGFDLLMLKAVIMVGCKSKLSACCLSKFNVGKMGLLWVLIMTFAGNISALDNGRVRRPQMGWNSWYGNGYEVDLPALKAVADALISTGLKDKGYNYVWIDAGWQVCPAERDANGTPLSQFSLQGFVDYCHARGLKPGIYTDTGDDGCGICFGSASYIKKDMDFFSTIGFDALKIDHCGGNPNFTDSQLSYQAFRDAINNRMDINICIWGIDNVPSWGPETGNSWRTGWDISNTLKKISWDGVSTGGAGVVPSFLGALHPASQGPGAYNDPDYLLIGEHATGNFGLTSTEQKSYFTLWCMSGAPLILGTDPRYASQQTLDIIGNQELIAVDQDSLGRQCNIIANEPEWLELNFGAAVTFNRVIVNENFDRVMSFKLETYVGGEWIPLTNGSTIGARKTIDFTSQTASKVRLYFTSVLNAPSIVEFEAYNNAGPNLALSATANSSSQWDSNYHAGMANDGSLSTRWNSAAQSTVNTICFTLMKNLQDTLERAVTFFNNTDTNQTMSVHWADIGLSGKQNVRDLWAHADLGVRADSFSAIVPSHGVFAMKISKVEVPTNTGVQPKPKTPWFKRQKVRLSDILGRLYWK